MQELSNFTSVSNIALIFEINSGRWPLLRYNKVLSAEKTKSSHSTQKSMDETEKSYHLKKLTPGLIKPGA
jgi:hypothetical protein